MGSYEDAAYFYEGDGYLFLTEKPNATIMVQMLSPVFIQKPLDVAQLVVETSGTHYGSSRSINGHINGLNVTTSNKRIDSSHNDRNDIGLKQLYSNLRMYLGCATITVKIRFANDADFHSVAIEDVVLPSRIVKVSPDQSVAEANSKQRIIIWQLLFDGHTPQMGVNYQVAIPWAQRALKMPTASAVYPDGYFPMRRVPSPSSSYDLARLVVCDDDLKLDEPTTASTVTATSPDLQRHPLLLAQQPLEEHGDHRRNQHLLQHINHPQELYVQRQQLQRQKQPQQEQEHQLFFSENPRSGVRRMSFPVETRTEFLQSHDVVIDDWQTVPPAIAASSSTRPANSTLSNDLYQGEPFAVRSSPKVEIPPKSYSQQAQPWPVAVGQRLKPPMTSEVKRMQPLAIPANNKPQALTESVRGDQIGRIASDETRRTPCLNMRQSLPRMRQTNRTQVRRRSEGKQEIVCGRAPHTERTAYRSTSVRPVNVSACYRPPMNSRPYFGSSIA